MWKKIQIMTLVMLGLAAGNSYSFDLLETGPNDTIGTAVNIDSWLSLGPHNDIMYSETIPWVSMHAATDIGALNPFDFFSFSVPKAGNLGIFDIDDTIDRPGNPIDLMIHLFDENGNFMISNDDSLNSMGAGGSLSNFDPYLEHKFVAAGTYGTYVIAVGKYNGPSKGVGSGVPSFIPDNYTLQISIGQDPNVVPVPGAIWLLGSGIACLAGLKRKKGGLS